MQSLSLQESRSEIMISNSVGFDAVAKTIKDILVEEIIPYGNVINSLLELGNSISNYFFCKKLVRFLEPMNDGSVSDDDVNRFFEQLDDNKYEVSEFLCTMLDKAESEVKATVLGIIYKAAVRRKINCEMMLRLISIVNHSFTLDLYKLPDYVNKQYSYSIEANNFINLGLIDNNVGGYWVNEPSWELNDVGKKLFEILQEEKWFK